MHAHRSECIHVHVCMHVGLCMSELMGVCVCIPVHMFTSAHVLGWGQAGAGTVSPYWGTVVTFPTLLWIGSATCPDAELKTQEDTKER